MLNSLPVLKSPLVDRWRRQIRYLRVSVTDRCNYRCAYCMPPEGFPLRPRDTVLTLEELTRFVGLMAEQGVQRVRITGGEPLVRRGVLGLIEHIAKMPAIQQVAMTTNAHILAEQAVPLWEAGLRGLSVSLDTFDPGRFEEITRGGDLARVVRGLRAATAAGFEDIRINAVSAKGLNDGHLGEFVRRCWDAGWIPRFIELMPVGTLDFQVQPRRVSQAQMLAELRQDFELIPRGRLGGELPRGPANYWEVSNGAYQGHQVGLISAMSEDGFCASCNRARLTASGGLRACLANDDEVSIREALRAGPDNEPVLALVRAAVEGKLEHHNMCETARTPRAVMTGIGG